MSLSWQHCTHFYYSPLSLCLTAAAHVTHLSTRTHTYRDIWTTANQRGGPPFTISDWFRPRYKPNGGLFLNHRTGDTFFSFLEWLDAPVRPGIFVSRTREKLGCTCDQIGRTLEPCQGKQFLEANVDIWNHQYKQPLPQKGLAPILIAPPHIYVAYASQAMISSVKHKALFHQH